MSHTHLDEARAANLAENPHAGQGPVLLDVGGDVGALVVHLDESFEGLEVEIGPAGSDAGNSTPYPHEHVHPAHPDDHQHHPHRTHVAVVGRPFNGSVAYSAVFPGLSVGVYELSIHGQRDTLRVDVPAGLVTEVAWIG